MSPTICLNMIVKNESKIITRLFDSVLPLINTYCICDTGSTDNTIELIESYFKEKKIHGKIVFKKFINFEANRNYSLAQCKGMSDYVLLLDADMILRIGPSFNKSLLTHDFYYILQGSESFHYKNIRIVRNDGSFEYSGVTHECINQPSGYTSKIFNSHELFINDVGDGGSKSDKFTRDIALLKSGIGSEPKNSRYYFYLANSYRDIGENLNAINEYKKRIEMGGWDQEVWSSYYNIGICYKRHGDIPNALFYFMKAHNYLPERVESLYEIINHYRISGEQKAAIVYYDSARKILDKNLDKNGYLFLYNDVYTYKCDYEYTIIAYYSGIKNINDQVIKVLSNCGDDSIIRLLLSNMRYYKYILEPAQVGKIFELPSEINKPGEKPNGIPNRLFKYVDDICWDCKINGERWVVFRLSVDSNKHNYHMLCVFGIENKLLRYSAPFKFTGSDVENCMGISVDFDKVSIYYTTRDDSSINLAEYSVGYINSVLKY